MEYICNEEITIKYGNKQKTYKNYILSEFLEKYAKNSVAFDHSVSGAGDYTEDMLYSFGMNIIYGYFTEEDITIDENTKFKVPNFNNLNDIVPLNACYDSHHDEYISFNVNIDMEYKPDKITYKYRYRLYDIEDAIIKNLIETQNQDYYGQKIGYLLFGDFNGIYAILDIRDENIYYTPNSNIDIFRKDYITTDGIFTSETVDYPYHLCSYVGEVNDIAVRQRIDSIGFGYRPDEIIEEISVDNLDLKLYKNNIYITTNMEGIGGEYATFPKNNKYLSNLKYPMRYVYSNINDKYPIIPSNNTYSSSSKYPMYYRFKLVNRKGKKYSLYPRKNLLTGRYYPIESKGNYKYVIIKYKLYDSFSTIVRGYYTMAYELDLKGKFKIHIKFERREI